MGTNNRARRRAKQAKQHRRTGERAGRGWSSPGGVGPGAAFVVAADVRAAVLELVRAWPREVPGADALVARLADAGVRSTLHEVAGVLLAHAVDDATGIKGWSAEGVARQARRDKRLDTDAAALAANAAVGHARSAFCVPPSPPAAAAGVVRALVASLAFLVDLPTLPPLLAPAPAVEDPEQARMLEKVRLLLAKAESTQYDEEAEAFTEKAQELMARYAIDEALLDASAGSGRDVGGMRIEIDDPYASAKSVLLAHIARENRCSAVWTESIGMSTVFGAHGDLRAVEILYTSLLVQAVAAMRRAGSQIDRSGRSRTRSFRHAFLVAFAQRIAERLREANRVVEQQVVDEVGGAFLPVLASRAEVAEQALAAAFPHMRAMRLTLSNGDGYRAGRAAADAASIERGAPLA